MGNNSAIKAVVIPTVESLGYELWGCVLLSQGSRSLLRVYIDSEQGVCLADCERVSRQLSAVLDVENPSLARYTLEVSSPGLDRPLFTPDQFRRFIGSQLTVSTRVFVENKKRFKGLLMATSEQGISLKQATEDVIALTWDVIMRANVLPEINK